MPRLRCRATLSTRRTTCVVKALTLAVVEYAPPASDVWNVNTLRGSRPGSTDRNPTKLRISSAAPTSSTSASAISATTSAERMRLWRTPVPERPLASFSVDTRSGFEVCSAGNRPNSRPVISETPIVKAMTRQSSGGMTTAAPLASVRRGMFPGTSISNPRTPAAPRARPRTPPHPASSTLSVSSWRTTRPRAAPIAERTANSRWRPAARASSRLATFAHAISSTSATAPNSTSSAVRTSPVVASRIGTTATLSSSSIHCGLALRNPRRGFHLRLRAVNGDARLQPAGHKEVMALIVLFGSACNGIQRSASGSAWNPFGMMPTIE